jgi:hypothetical protein
MPVAEQLFRPPFIIRKKKEKEKSFISSGVCD